MTGGNSLSKDQVEIHLGHLFHLFPDESKIYFHKDRFRLKGTNVNNTILRCQSNT